MKKYFILTVMLLIIMSGCQQEVNLDKELSEKVKTFTENDYLFSKLEINYEECKEAMKDITCDSFDYIKHIDDKMFYSIIGKGAEEIKIKGIDFKGLSKEEFEKKRQEVKKLWEKSPTNLNDYKITTKVSKVYNEKVINEERKYVLSQEIIELNDNENSVIVYNKKYIFENQDGSWKIKKILSDMSSYSHTLLKERNISESEFISSHTRFDMVKNGEVEYILSLTLQDVE